MLLRKQGSGYQHSYLFAAVYGQESGAHGDFGLAKTDVAANQAVHRLRVGHVLQYGGDGGFLVGGFLEREVVRKALVVALWGAEAEPFTRGAPCIHIEQFGSHVADFFGGLALGFLPGFRAQAVQRSVLVFGAGVAGDQVQVGNRHIKLGFVCIAEHQKLGLLIFDRQVGQSEITAHAVVDVHYR